MNLIDKMKLAKVARQYDKDVERRADMLNQQKAKNSSHETLAKDERIFLAELDTIEMWLETNRFGDETWRYRCYAVDKIRWNEDIGLPDSEGRKRVHEIFADLLAKEKDWRVLHRIAANRSLPFSLTPQLWNTLVLAGEKGGPQAEKARTAAQLLFPRVEAEHFKDKRTGVSEELLAHYINAYVLGVVELDKLQEATTQNETTSSAMGWYYAARPALERFGVTVDTSTMMIATVEELITLVTQQLPNWSD